MTKFCHKCQASKPVSMFSACRRNKDGLQAYCKGCRLEMQREYRATQPEKYLDAARRRDPEKNRQACREWSSKNREKIYEIRRRYPERDKARRSYRYAIETGVLVRPDTCEMCGEKPKVGKIQGHHEDYSKPLEVKWLCVRCHGFVHRKRPEVAA